jgi:hypothetical protein
MSDKREFKQTDTSTSAKMDNNEQPGLPVKIPLSIVRWLVYSVTFSGALALWYPQYVGWDGLVGTCLILGHFASQLNALIKK